jgi:hypothetical protein
MIPEPPNGDFMAAFKDTYRREFGFDLEDPGHPRRRPAGTLPGGQSAGLRKVSIGGGG